MKKMFFFAAIASVAFASCTNDENTFEGVKNGREMTFVAADYVHQTRAGEHDLNEAFSNADYQVWAWVDGTDDAHISALKVLANGTYTGKYYWPDEALDFAAISPANDPRIKVARTAGGATTVTYTFDATNGNNQTNLMHADFVDAQKKATPPAATPAVALGFRHALAKLNVVVQQTQTPSAGAPDGTSDVKGYQVIVNSLSIDGFHTQGKYVVENNDQNIEDNVWEIASPGATTSWEIITSKTPLATTNTTPFTDKVFTATYNTTGYVMPQELANSVMVNFDYDIVTVFKSGATSTINRTASVVLNTIKNGANPIKNWYTNKNITYTFTINPQYELTPITFDADEEEWGSENGSTIVDPIP